MVNRERGMPSSSATSDVERTSGRERVRRPVRGLAGRPDQGAAVTPDRGRSLGRMLLRKRQTPHRVRVASAVSAVSGACIAPGKQSLRALMWIAPSIV